MPVSRYAIVLISLFSIVLAGCGTRSISNAGFKPNPYYKGELSEFAVIGIDPKTGERAWGDVPGQTSPLTLPPGSHIMLIQSGTEIPDGELVAEMERVFRVSVFSGSPPAQDGGPEGKSERRAAYASALRAAAMSGGMDYIVCVWGLIDDHRARKAGKTISWVPIVGAVIPDEKQHMSIRLKVAVVDVETGDWGSFLPPAFDSSRFSSRTSRSNVDQKQVYSLKSDAYRAAVDALVARFGSR